MIVGKSCLASSVFGLCIRKVIRCISAVASVFSCELRTRKSTCSKEQVLRYECRKEAIRTPDPYVPNVVRYQLRYFPIAPAKLVIFGDMAKVFPYFFVFTSIVILGRWGSLVMSRMRGLPRWASELLVILIFNLAVAPGFNVTLERETLMPRL